MYKILHFADLHLDASFGGIGFPSLVARKFRESLREALVRILDLAQEKQVQAVTIAGDLYENERFSRDTGEFLVQQFQRIAPIKIFISPGNHDPFMPDSLYQFLKWPGNVTIFQTKDFTPIQLTKNSKLWGMAHTSPSSRKNPMENFQVPENGQHILLFHGSDTSSIPAGKTAHAPFVLMDLLQTGADMALVGHYHNSKQKSLENKTFYYPGSPEPLSFGEKDNHFVGLISITDEKIEIESLSINKYRFLTEDIDVTGTVTRDEIKTRLEDLIKTLNEDSVFLKINLIGILSPQVDLDLALLNERLNECFEFGIVIDRTETGIDFLSLAEEKTVRGEFVRTLLQKIETSNEEEKRKLREALRFGILAFEGRELVKI